MNSIAMIQSSAITSTTYIGDWQALAGGVTRTIAGGKISPPGSASYFQRPGDVYTMAAIKDPKGRANARRVFFAGQFTQVGEIGASSIARFSVGGDEGWNNMKGGISSPKHGANQGVYAIDTFGTKVYIGGQFERAGNVSVSNIAMWDDEKETWSALGAGIGGTNSYVYSILAISDTKVLVGGQFTTAGGLPVNNIALWNGNAWEKLKCDYCKTYCDERNSGYSCDDMITDYVYSIERVLGKIYIRTGDDFMAEWDGSYLRPATFGTYTDDGWYFGNLHMTPAPPGSKGNVWGTFNTDISDSYVSNFAEVDTNTLNIYNLGFGGFNSYISAVSSGAFVTAGWALVVASVLYTLTL
jgi:hypothetical protein